MTVKLVVLYTQPQDPAEFDRHYAEVHAPLVRAIPGLQQLEVSRLVAAADNGELSYYQIAELRFADQESLQAGLGSAEGQATAADFGTIAPPGSRLFVATVDQ